MAVVMGQFFSQGLEDQVSRLASQIKEQEERVTKVAPDPKELKKLEAEVYKSTQSMSS